MRPSDEVLGFMLVDERAIERAIHDSERVVVAGCEDTYPEFVLDWCLLVSLNLWWRNSRTISSGAPLLPEA